MPNPVYEDIFKLPAEARMELVYDLLESLDDEPEQAELQNWQLEELDRREARALATPGQGKNWEDVKEAIRAKHAVRGN
jgi:putative addiction module component (TIGR02574 family)